MNIRKWKIVQFFGKCFLEGYRVRLRYFIDFVFVSRSAKLKKKSLIHLKFHAEIKDYVIIQSFQEKVTIGSYTQINPFTVIYCGSRIQIGNHVMIGPHCMIASGDHDFEQIDKPMRHAGSLSKGPIIIEDDVWVGANCTITDNVKIGKGSVIGANSVVTKDVAPYSIVAGVPAKLIRHRK